MSRTGLRQRGAKVALRAVLLAVAVALTGCKVVTIAQDQAIRAKRSLNFNADAYVAKIWDAQALPELRRRAAPANELLAAIDSNPDEAGARLGRRASEGGAWTFVVSGEGVVRAVDDSSRRRTVEVSVGEEGARTVRLEAGPVVVGTALRDALPFIAFDDFSDQLAFADVGRALTTTALSRTRSTLEGLRPGDRIRFVGAFNLPAAGQPVFVMPVSVGKAVS